MSQVNTHLAADKYKDQATLSRSPCELSRGAGNDYSTEACTQNVAFIWHIFEFIRIAKFLTGFLFHDEAESMSADFSQVWESYFSYEEYILSACLPELRKQYVHLSLK